MQYWPPAIDKQEVYGDIHIGIVNEEQLANFQIRTFKVWKLTPEVRGRVQNVIPLFLMDSYDGFLFWFAEYYSRRASHYSISLH